MRIDQGVARGPAFEIFVDGAPCRAFPGETVAAVLLANGRASLRRDNDGQPRGLFCNMGTCCECMVTVGAGDNRRRVRGCLVDAVPGLVVTHG